MESYHALCIRPRRSAYRVVEPRGIESPATAPSTGNSDENERLLCVNCAGNGRPRNIPRNISGAERRGPTVQEGVSVWALTYALEAALDRRRRRGPYRESPLS